MPEARAGRAGNTENMWGYMGCLSLNDQFLSGGESAVDFFTDRSSTAPAEVFVFVAFGQDQEQTATDRHGLPAFGAI